MLIFSRINRVHSHKIIGFFFCVHSTLSLRENSSCCLAFHSDFTFIRFRLPSLKEECTLRKLHKKNR